MNQQSIINDLQEKNHNGKPTHNDFLNFKNYSQKEKNVASFDQNSSKNTIKR